MTASTNPRRHYDASDLKAVTDATGEWASNWDDVLHYLEGPAKSHPELSEQEISELVFDINVLKSNNIAFTSNYREIWNQLDGGLSNRNDELDAEARGSVTASSRVDDIMHRLESKEYQEMAERLARSRDLGWDRE